MKKGFFLLAAMSAVFNQTNVGNQSLNKVNDTLRNCPNRSGGRNKPSKNTGATIIGKKRKHKKELKRITGRSRNINHKKAA